MNSNNFHELKIIIYLHRCSLDKVILKIKLMSEVEEYGYIFNNPYEVLGRAI